MNYKHLVTPKSTLTLPLNRLVIYQKPYIDLLKIFIELRFFN